MDLGTVGAKLQRGEYQNTAQFVEDVRQVWQNCRLYNAPQSEPCRAAERLSALFERRLAEAAANTLPAEVGASEGVLKGTLIIGVSEEASHLPRALPRQI